MDCVVLLNALQVIVYQEVPSISIEIRTAWEWILFLFYFSEMLLKLIVHGPRAYWADNWNKFDVVSVFSSFISLLVVSGFGTCSLPLFISAVWLIFIICRATNSFFRSICLVDAISPSLPLYASRTSFSYH